MLCYTMLREARRALGRWAILAIEIAMLKAPQNLLPRTTLLCYATLCFAMLCMLINTPGLCCYAMCCDVLCAVLCYAMLKARGHMDSSEGRAYLPRSFRTRAPTSNDVVPAADAAVAAACHLCMTQCRYRYLERLGVIEKGEWELQVKHTCLQLSSRPAMSCQWPCSCCCIA